MTLICEGPCNPELQRLDKIADTERQLHEKQCGRMPKLHPGIVVSLKQSRLTKHTLVSVDWWECSECGNVRRCGNTI